MYKHPCWSHQHLIAFKAVIWSSLYSNMFRVPPGKVLECRFPDEKRRGGFTERLQGFGRVVVLTGKGRKQGSMKRRL